MLLKCVFSFLGNETNLTEPSFEAHKKMIEAKNVGFVKVNSLYRG